MSDYLDMVHSTRQGAAGAIVVFGPKRGRSKRISPLTRRALRWDARACGRLRRRARGGRRAQCSRRSPRSICRGDSGPRRGNSLPGGARAGAHRRGGVACRRPRMEGDARRGPRPPFALHAVAAAGGGLPLSTRRTARRGPGSGDRGEARPRRTRRSPIASASSLERRRRRGRSNADRRCCGRSRGRLPRPPAPRLR
jgi:hypothetical protein